MFDQTRVPALRISVQTDAMQADAVRSFVWPSASRPSSSIRHPHERHRKLRDLPSKIKAGPQELLAAVSQLQASLDIITCYLL